MKEEVKDITDQPKHDPNARRLAVVYVSEAKLFRIFFSAEVHPEFVRIPTLRLPPDAAVTRVFYDPCRGAFGFVIKSAAFDEAPEAAELAQICLHEATIKLARSFDFKPV